MPGSWPTITARLTDWDDAYANRPYIANAEGYLERWPKQAAAFRDDTAADLGVAYGDDPRQAMDIFRPDGAARGLAVFVHGGYWHLFDRSPWSHLAAGALDRGWAVAVPSYRLAPDVRIGSITRDVAAAVDAAAARVAGPICLSGHSAGGHLVSRMVCDTAPLDAATKRRIARCLSISGVHDLRPLLRTQMNETLGLDEAEAVAESPALTRPETDAAITCWVGGAERPEFIRQTELLANIWYGLGADVQAQIVPGKDHFSVVEDLADSGSALVDAFVGPA